MGIVYPKINGVVTWSNGSTTLHKEQAWADTAKLVRERPELFADAPLVVHGADSGVEQATAAPGEKRTTRRKTKKTDSDSGKDAAAEGEE